MTDEGGGEVGLPEAARAEVEVFGAKTRGGAGDGMAAAASGAGAVLTAGQVLGRAGVNGLFVHGEAPFLDFGWKRLQVLLEISARRDPYTPAFLRKSAEAVDAKGVGPHS